MAEWLVRVQDTREEPIIKASVREMLYPAFASKVLTVVSGPYVVFHNRGDRPGEWCFRLEAGNEPASVVQMRIISAITRCNFLIAGLCRAEPKPARAPALPPVQARVPIQRRKPVDGPRPLRVVNSPYSSLGRDAPYAGDTR